MTPLPPLTPERNKILTLSKILLSAFVLVGMALLYWGVFRAGALLARDDNPRRMQAELRVHRGTISDRSGALLAYDSDGPEDRQRVYPSPAGGHAVGYYSLLHGVAGAEAGFDEQLRGETADFWAGLRRDLLHRPPDGRDVQLALDYAAQQTAVRALGDGRGGALLLEIAHDEPRLAWVRAMASTPGYDANRLDDAFAELGDDAGAPLLNRVTQGQYQPGLILQPLILAAAADKGLIRLDQPVEGAGRTVTINGDVLSCASRPPEAATWADVLAHRCPAPMRDLAEALGVEGLEAAFAAFGLDRRPLLELDTATVPGAPLANPRLAGIGQEHLSVTPLQVALAMAALAGGGAVPQAQLGQAVRDEGGSWQPWRLPDGSGTAVSSAAARAVREALPQEGGILEFSPVVLSGPDGSTNAWYVGMRAGENEDYVAVVVLEDSAEQGEAQAVGRSLLETARRP